MCSLIRFSTLLADYAVRLSPLSSKSFAQQGVFRRGSCSPPSKRPSSPRSSKYQQSSPQHQTRSPSPQPQQQSPKFQYHGPHPRASYMKVKKKPPKGPLLTAQEKSARVKEAWARRRAREAQNIFTPTEKRLAKLISQEHSANARHITVDTRRDNLQTSVTEQGA